MIAWLIGLLAPYAWRLAAAGVALAFALGLWWYVGHLRGQVRVLESKVVVQEKAIAVERDTKLMQENIHEMSTEELAAYFRTGVLPERLRRKAGGSSPAP